MNLFDLGPVTQQRNKYDCIFPPIPKFSKVLGMDTETYLISEDEPIPRMVCITFSDNTIYAASPEEKLRGVQKFLEALEEPGTIIVGHNVFYDLSVIIRFLVEIGMVTSIPATERYFWEKIKAGKIRDTQVLAQLIAIRYDWLRFDPVSRGPAEFSLEALMKRHCGIIIAGKHGEDVWRLRYKELDGIPTNLWPIAATTYAINDAVYAAQLYAYLVEKYGNSADEIFQVESGWVLHKMGVWGITTDPILAEELESRIMPFVKEAQATLIAKGIFRPPEIKIRRDKIKEILKSLDGYKPTLTPTGDISLSDANLRRAKHPLIKAYLQHKDDKDMLLALGLAEEEEPTKNMEAIRKIVEEYYPDPPRTDKGQVSTDRGTIEQIPELKELADIGEFEKIRTTYIPIFKAGKTLHPRWNGLVATGRVSVSQPNLNNMPRGHGVRECFKARKGYVFVSADYAQAELCSLAQICIDKFGYSHMADAINSGKDLHILLASQLIGISYEEAYAKYKTGDKTLKDLRQLAKAANFGFPGGLGPDKFIDYAYTSYKVSITREEAVNLKAVWIKTYPEVNEYFKWISKRLQGKSFDYIQHRSGRIRGKVGFCDGCNTGFQGLTADGAKYAKNMISYNMYCNEDSPLYGAHIVAFIYDELLIEVPEEKAHEAALELQRLMIEGMRTFTPDVLAKVEIDMMYHWSKAAKAVYENGRLVPFDKEKYEVS